MNNIYYDLYSNVDLINEKSFEIDLNLYTTLSPPISDFIWKESAKNKKYKNVFGDTFLERNLPVSKTIYNINVVNDKLIFKIGKRLGVTDWDSNVYNCLSNDGLNTYIKTLYEKNQLQGYPANTYSKNRYYTIKNNRNLMYTEDMINFNTYCSFDSDINEYYVSNENDIYMMFKLKDRPGYNDPNYYYINSDGFKHKLNYSDSISYGIYQNGVRSFKNKVYLNKQNGIYISEDKINFKLISTSDNNNRVKLGHFLSDGKNVSINNHSGYSGEIQITKNFIDYTTILKYKDVSSITPNYLNVIDDIIYVCCDSGVRYSNDFGKTWSIYEIPKSTSIAKHNNKLYVAAEDGIYLI